MIELEKLLNDLYKNVPVKLQELKRLDSFNIPQNIKDKKEIFNLLDDIISPEGTGTLSFIKIYKAGSNYQLKIYVNTI